MSDSKHKRRSAVKFIVKTEKPLDRLDTKLGEVTIVPYEEGDEHGILELFKTVFKVDRTLDQWNWEFRDNPNGMHIYVGKLADGTIVSQYTGILTKGKIFDRDVLFSQIVDSMVHPQCRSGLKKKGLFALTLLNHSYKHGHLQDECIQMGLPNPLAYRLGSQTCYYVPMTKAYVHHKEVNPDDASEEVPSTIKGLGNTYEVSMTTELAHDHDHLWARVKDKHRIITWRNKEFWEWRYVQNPHFDYLTLELRDPSDGALAASAVCRVGWLDQPDFVIADWLVDLDRVGAAEAMIKVCEEAARRSGMKSVKCFLNHNAPESRTFEDVGYNLLQTQFRLVSHTYAPEFVTERDLMNEWYYTLGDFDIV
ncbi:MAG: hypothetical protein ACI97A_000491 [Planctomycetota bacterium]|jgi:hypothetical protein